MPLDLPPPPPAIVQPAFPAGRQVADRWRHPAIVYRRTDTGTPPKDFGLSKF